jgi:cysteine-rich repeat protein
MTSLRRHFDRLDAWLIATSVISALAIALVHCNDDAVCGNNIVEDKEQCDVGMRNGVENSGCSSTCTIAALNVAGLQLIVAKLKDEAMGFPGVGCSELGATMQHVVITGPTSVDQTVDCGMSPAYLNHDIPPGDYSATVTLLDGSGNALTKPVTVGPVTAMKGQTAMMMANFAQADFLKQDYTGTLFFKPSWGAANTKCDAASPVVTGYGVTLKDKNGVVVAGMSSASRKLDGTMGACFDPGPTGTAESVAGLTWGHYGLTFTGYAGATLAYCKTFDVFSGPGTANATYDLVVTSADPDAGVSCP